MGLGVLASAPLSAQQFDFLHGHFEIQADYTAADGWWFGNSYNKNNDFNDRTQIRRLEGGNVRFITPPLAQTELTAAVSFLGEEGEPAWVLPQFFEFGTHYLGMRIIVDPLIFQTRVGNTYRDFSRGTVAMRMLSVTGSGPDRGGHFALWERDDIGASTVYFNSKDGIDGADEIPALGAGAHSHFAWGFTQPGEYAVELEVYGRLRGTPPTGDAISTTQTFNFLVPHSGAVSQVNAHLCREGERWELALADNAAGVVYGERRAFVEVPAASGGFECPVALSAEGIALSDNAGLPSTLAQSGAGADLPNGLSLRLVRHVGPGEVSMGSAIDSANGLDSQDEVSLATVFSDTLRFTESGIHTLVFEASGTTAAGASLTSQELVVRCGAGLEIDYDFAEWADSYERAHGLAAASLSDPMGDHNQDGVAHQLEYLLDVGGADPVLGGGQPCLEVEPDGSHTRMVFFRDLHKDGFERTVPELHAGFSSDLTNWQYLTPSNPGFPLETFELGNEEGNAVSLLMKRALRSPVAENPRAFFQLQSPENQN